MPVDRPAVDHDLAGVAGCRPETRDRVVDLPQPVGPTTVTNSPRADVEVDVADGGVAAAVRVGKLLVAPARRIAGGSCRAPGSFRAAEERGVEVMAGTVGVTWATAEALSTLREQCA